MTGHFCPNCGVSVADDAHFCVECGSDLVPASTPPPVAAQQPPMAPPPPGALPSPLATPAPAMGTPPPPSGSGSTNRNLIIGIVVGLAIVAVLAAGLFAVLRDSGGDTAEAPTADSQETATTGASSDTALDTKVPDLCTLFTAEDFQTVTGEKAGESVSDPGTGAIRGTCTTSAEAGFPLVFLAAYNESDREATLSMVEAQPVDDLGREAYWDDTLGLVIPLEGKDWYLQVLATDGGANLDTSAQVAEIALDRLSG